MLKKIGYIPLFLWAVISLFPFYWLFLNAIKPGTSVMSIPPDLSWSNFTFENFEKLFSNSYIWPWTMNSFILSFGAVFGNVVLCSMCGYVFAKKKFPGRVILFWMTIAVMMTSTQVIMVPLFMLVRDLGMLNTHFGLVLPVMVAPFAVFLTKQFMQTIPGELIAASRIDGCSEWGIYVKIIVPLSKPVLAIVAIFSFITQWNEFLWPLLVTDSREMRTLQVGLASLQLQQSSNYGLILAGAVWTMLPVLIIFLSLQKFFVKGITIGAVKG